MRQELRDSSDPLAKPLDSMAEGNPAGAAISSSFQKAEPPSTHKKRVAVSKDDHPRKFISLSLRASHHEGHDPEDQEDDEEDLRDTDGGAGDPAEAEDGGEECDDEEYEGPVEHGFRVKGWSNPPVGRTLRSLTIRRGTVKMQGVAKRNSSESDPSLTPDVSGFTELPRANGGVANR